MAHLAHEVNHCVAMINRSKPWQNVLLEDLLRRESIDADELSLHFAQTLLISGDSNDPVAKTAVIKRNLARR